jgi:hypothetical protein
MRQPKNLDKKITLITVSLIIWVFAISLINPAISKRPERTIKVPDDRAITGEGNIEVYWDSKCTKRVSSIDWGLLKPGTNQTVTLFIKNKGKTPVTLSYYTSNWNPSEVTNYLYLSWNYTGQVINFKETTQVSFTLHASENVEVEAFSFDITTIGT